MNGRSRFKSTLEANGYKPKRYINFAISPGIPQSHMMTWGQIKELFAGEWSGETGFYSYGGFYSRGLYGTEALNLRSLHWDNFDPEASGYIIYKSLPTNSDYFPRVVTSSTVGKNREFLDSLDLDSFVGQSDFIYGDTLYNGGGAPYFYRIASYTSDPFQLNHYSDELCAKSIGIGMDSVAQFYWYDWDYHTPWTPHFKLATINERDYIFFPSAFLGPVSIYDVTDVRNRQWIAGIPISYCAMDVAVKDTLCFVVEAWGPYDNILKFSIWNVADPSNPIYVDGLLIPNYYPLKIEVGNQKLYIFCTEGGYVHEDQYIIKVDVSDPENPVQEGILGVGSNYKDNDMKVVAPYIYVSRGSYGISIYNCENLNYVGSFPSRDTLTFRSIDCQNGKLYAIRSTPLASCTTFTDFFLDIIDVSDPALPFLVSSSYIFELSPLDREYYGGIHVQGDYVYLNAFSFLCIFNVSNETDVYLTERIRPLPIWFPPHYYSLIAFQGDVIAKGDKIFGLFAQTSCNDIYPHCFSGFYSVQTFGLVNDIILTGDVNADGEIGLSDIVYLVNYLFKGGPPPFPLSLAEVNGDGRVTLSDIVYLINYLFKGGPPPKKIYISH